MSVDKKEWDVTFAKQQQHQHQQETLAEGGAMNGDVATTAAAATTTTTMTAATKAATIATTKKEGDSSTSTDKSSSRKLTSGATAKGEASQEDAKQKNTPGNTNAATATPATTSKTTSTPSSSPASSSSVSTSVPSKTTNSSQQEPNDAEVYRIQDKTTPQRNKEHPTASPATTATLVPVSPEIDNKISAKGTPKPSAVSCVTPPSSSHNNNNNNNKAVVTPNAKSVDDNKNSNNSMTPLTKIDATAQEVAEHVCLVFPSAAAAASDKTKAIASSTTSHSAVPFVTLHPVFGKKHNKGASAVLLLRALDGMLQQLLPDSNSSASFLSPEWFLSAEETWKAQGITKNKKKGRQSSLPSVEKLCRDRLQSLWNTAIEQKAPVLLFLVLLVRMEVAVYLSFHRQRREQHSTVIDSTRLQPAHLTKLLELLESLAKPSASLDTTQLNKIISPLVDGGFCSFEIDNKSASVVMNDVKLGNLLITPLPVAVKIFSTAQSGNDKALWDHWDKAWRATLQNMRDHAFPPSQHPMTPTRTGKKSAKKSNNEVPAKSKAEIGDLKDEGAEWMDSTTSTNDPATLAIPSANNARNKKRKKRKVRRSCVILVCVVLCCISLCWMLRSERALTHLLLFVIHY